MNSIWKTDCIGICLIVGMAAAAYQFDVVPTMRRSSAAAAEARALVDEQSKVRTLEKSLAATESSVRQAAQTLEKNRVKLEPYSNLNSRIARLNDFAARHGLQMNAIEPGDPQAAIRSAVVPIKISGQGTYQACSKWMSDLRQEMPDMNVGDFQLSAAKPDKMTPVQLTAQLLWHTAPLPAKK